MCRRCTELAPTEPHPSLARATLLAARRPARRKSPQWQRSTSHYRRSLPPSYRLRSLIARTGGRDAIHNTHRHRNGEPGLGGTATGSWPHHPHRPSAVNAEQHPLGLSILLHLAPGAALTGFVIAAKAALGLEPLLGLLIGILVILAPLELGYLAA